MRYTLWLLVIISIGSELGAVTGKYPIQHFTPSEYQAGNQNIDFAQNRDMKIFVANNLGVLSYNGINWTTHAFRTGKKKRSLAFDDDSNRLYIGSQGDFGYFENNWTYISLINKIPEALRDFDEVWDVYIHNSEVYFCTFQGIYIYDGKTINVIQHKDGLAKSFYVNNKLFAQSQKGELFEVQEGRLVETYTQNQSGQIISGIIYKDDGLLLFYNSGQIAFSTPFGTSRIYKDLILALQGSYVNHVLELSDTKIAIATQTAGLFLYDAQRNTIENIGTKDGLATNACLRSFQDYEGNLWLGLQNGIALLQINSPMRLINQEINLQGSGYEAMKTNEGVYYSTSNGIYFSAKGTDNSVFINGTEGPAYSLQDINGQLYAGHHTGLFLLKGNSAKRMARTDGLWHLKQLRMNPGYAIGGGYSGLHLFKLNNNQNIQYIDKITGFNESSRFFEEDMNGNIWVGQYYKGLYQLKLSNSLKEVTVKIISDENSSPSYDQIVLSRVNNDLIIATKTGVYEIDQLNETIVPSERFSNVVGEQQVYLFEQDNQKNIHIVAENLIGFFKQISTNNYVFVPSSLHHLRYYLNNDLLQVSINVDDGLLFSSNEGFIYYNPQLENKLDLEQPIVVNNLYSVTQDSVLYMIKPFDEISQDLRSMTIDHKSKVLQFNVESFQFYNKSNHHFRYYLKGFEKDYGSWTSSSSKEYSNLKEGDYEFTVQTRNYLGVINNSEPLALKVNPPLHRTLAAKVIYTLAGLATLFFIYRFQKNRFKKKTAVIEKSKQQELIDLEQVKEQELSQLQDEKLESELRHVNNLLAASTMNLVVKNEFIESIKEELNAVKQKGKNVETKKALEGIVKEIDQALRLQEDWEQFELHFDQVHGDFLTRVRDEFIDLSPNEQKLCALLRLNLSTKEIANLMSISLRGVEVARYRLRKKLDLNKGQNLSKFILEY